MISIEELKKYAETKNFNLGQAEKDYFQEIILFSLYKEFGKELVFKGGTALTKCYGFDRFSEDLDFTSNEDKDFKKIINKTLNAFYIEYEVQEKTYEDAKKITYKIKGPLYNENRISLCKIEIDVSLREKTILETETKKIGLQIEQIPSFEVIAMNEKEIFAEKIRAILTRNSARDIYDLYHLIKKGIKTEKELIQEKLKNYKEKYTKETIKRKLEEKKEIYDKELKHLTKKYPKFEDAYNLITKNLP